jgi:hypothetical protein
MFGTPQDIASLIRADGVRWQGVIKKFGSSLE